MDEYSCLDLERKLYMVNGYKAINPHWNTLFILICSIFFAACTNNAKLPEGIGDLDSEVAIFSQNDLAMAERVNTISVTRLTGEDLSGVEINIESTQLESPEGDLSTAAKLDGVKGVLAYYRYNESVYQIWIQDQFTDIKTKIYSSKQKVQSVATTGNGSIVVATVENPAHGEFDVYLFNVLNSTIINLTDSNNEDELDVSITANGKKIVWSGPNGDLTAIRICDYDSTTKSCSIKKLNSSKNQKQPTITGNGKYIALIRELPGNLTRVIIYDIENNNYTKVVTRTDELSHPSASNSGDQVMYLRDKGTKYVVRVKNLNTNETNGELSSSTIGHVHMTSDGANLAYDSQSSEYRKVRTRDIASDKTVSSSGGEWHYYGGFWQLPTSVAQNNPPTVKLTPSRTKGEVPLTVVFRTTASDPDGDTLTYSWDFGDGGKAGNKNKKTHTYQNAGTYTTKVTVSDGKGRTASDSVEIKVIEVQDGDAQIQCIRYNPDGIDAGNEYVDIKALGTIDFSGWYLEDIAGNRVSAPKVTAISGQVIRFQNDKAIWNNDGDTAKLYNSNDVLKDQFTYVGGGASTCASSQTLQYEGEWVWLAQFSFGTDFSGRLSVSTKLDDGDTSRNVEGGAWRWCVLSPCESGIDGAGLIGEFKSNGQYKLLTSFAKTSGFIKVIAIDADNKIGTEVQGKPTFLGLGLWFFDTGGDASISFGMTKISDKPSITSSATSLSINSIKFNPQLSNQSQSSGNFDYIINKLEELVK